MPEEKLYFSVRYSYEELGRRLGLPDGVRIAAIGPQNATEQVRGEIMISFEGAGYPLRDREPISEWESVEQLLLSAGRDPNEDHVSIEVDRLSGLVGKA